MSIRLNKVTRDLNVGMTTLVDFLQKKGHVVENNPNTKITEEEYEILVKEFSQDMTLKKEAERLVYERLNREKQKIEEATPKADEVVLPVVEPKQEIHQAPVSEPFEDELADLRPHIKQVGKIDIDAINRKPKPVEKVSVPKQTENIEEKTVSEVIDKKAEPVAPEEKTPGIPHRKSEEPEKAPEIRKEEKPIVLVEKVIIENEPVEVEPEVFTLGDRKIESNIKVIKTIDLDALNQSTRPKKKSQAEKRKEREEKLLAEKGQRQPAVKSANEQSDRGIKAPVLPEESGSPQDLAKKEETQSYQRRQSTGQRYSVWWYASWNTDVTGCPLKTKKTSVEIRNQQ